MISMTLNQLLVVNISLYLMFDMNARYARVSPISDMKNPHRYDPDIRYLEPYLQSENLSNHLLQKHEENQTPIDKGS